MRTMARIMALALTAALAWGCSDDKEKLKTGDSGADSKAADKKVTPQDTGPGLEAMIYPEAGGDATADAGKPDMGKPDAAAGKYWTEFAYSPSGKVYSVMGTSATNVFAVGQKGLLIKYNGTSWSSMTNPDTSKADLHQLIVHPSASKWYALGAQMYLTYTGSAWAKGYSSTTSYYYNFRGGWGPPNGYVYGVGEMNSGSYYYMSYKTTSSSGIFYSISFGSSGVVKGPMYGAWGLSNGKVWAVGNNGAIIRCNTSGYCTSSSYWKKETSGVTSHLRDIYGFSDKDVFAVGYDGVILRYNGTKWNKMTTNTSTYFHGVWGSSPTNVFAVGHPIFKAQDSIFRFDGTKWLRVSPPKTSYCNDVWGASASDIFVVCNFNILKWKGP